MNQRKTILFFAEPATLAHVARPVVLAAALGSDLYDVTVATGPDFHWIVKQAGLKSMDMYAIGVRAYLDAVAAGRPVFPYRVLERYVQDDLRVINVVRPDLIVGDFRLSLAVSARLSKVPYLAISNAYWSPFASARFDVPAHFLTRCLGPWLLNPVFQMCRPLIFAQHSLPMHRLRKKHGMPSLGFDLRTVFTEADKTLFADVPELVPTANCGIPGRYVYIGPVTWSPAGDVPSALTDTSDARPLAYVALGSSGDPRLLGSVVDALSSLDCRVAVATGSGGARLSFPDGVLVAKYLPGDALARLSRVVICNGGSPATHQALKEGTPVLGIPENLDQLLNMQFITASGAGLSLRADQVTMVRVRHLVQRLLGEEPFEQRARYVANRFMAYCAAERFAEEVRQLFGGYPS